MANNTSARQRNPATTAVSLVGRMAAGVALVNLFVVAAVTFSLYQSHREFKENADLTARNMSQMLAHDIAGGIGKIDVALLAAADEIEHQMAGGGINQAALKTFLVRLQGRLPEIVGLRATDAEGIVSHGPNVSSGVRQNNSDREYFIRQRDNPNAGLVIAGPVFARIDKQWVIPMSRPIRRADGSFGGVVYANLTLDYLTKVFATLDVGARGSISVRDTELRIYAHHPAPADMDKVIGRPLAVPELHAMIQTGRDAGTYVSDHTVDGVERKFAVRKISGYPLYAVVGRATDEYMARWWDQAVKTLLLAALFCLTTLLSSWLIYRGWQGQVAATLELAREEEKFHTVADYTYDWEYWEGPAKELRYISPSCQRVTGYSPAEFQAEPELLYRIIHPDDSHLMAEHRRNARHHETTSVDFRIIRKDGTLCWVGHACQPVFGRDGEFMGRRASNRDITERKEAEATVSLLNEELEQRVARRTAQLEVANKELEEFSYSISHDLRTPVRAIAGFAQILVEEHAASLDSEGRRLLGVVRANTVRMGELIDELLEFLQLGRRQFRFAAADTAQLAREVFAELQAAAPERELRLELRNPPPAWGDRIMIRHLFMNLLSNAVKFTQPRPQAVIEIGGEEGTDENTYYVKDNGVGFDMKYVDKLFKIFEHVHPPEQFAGSGTGLAMVKRIVNRHGGRVWAEGQVDGGATFYFTLPAKEKRHDSGN